MSTLSSISLLLFNHFLTMPWNKWNQTFTFKIFYIGVFSIIPVFVCLLFFSFGNSKANYTLCLVEVLNYEKRVMVNNNSTNIKWLNIKKNNGICQWKLKDPQQYRYKSTIKKTCTDLLPLYCKLSQKWMTTWTWTVL